jgi:saccharopine dehydrogenase (NAD+, L-lysine-forming)
MSRKTLHLRAEAAPFGTRAIITPESAKQLISDGYNVHIERSSIRFFSDDEYEAAGATLVPTGSWVSAPRDHLILGMKGIPMDDFPLKHVHVHAAHAYRNQAGWDKVLNRFRRGDGLLLELEFLVNDKGEKLLTFSTEAGAMAAALSIKTWAHQLVHPNAGPLPGISAYQSRAALLEETKRDLAAGQAVAGRLPTIILIGAHGTSGVGSASFFANPGIPAANMTKWGCKETSRTSEYPEVLQHDIFINCISIFAPVPPFLTMASLDAPDRRLSVVCNISTDSKSPNNTIQIYQDFTSDKQPTLQVPIPCGPPLSVIAVPYLPSLLPRDSSQTAGKALYPAITKLDAWRQHRLWRESEQMYHDKVATVPQQEPMAML